MKDLTGKNDIRTNKINEGRRKFFENTMAAGALVAGATLSSNAFAKPSSATLTRQVIEPLPWQAGYGFVTGNIISGEHRTFYMAGQGPTDEQGNVLHPNDMAGQINQTLDNMEKALKEVGMSWSNLVNLAVYTTDMQGFFEVYEQTIYKRVSVDGGGRFGGSLLQISGFAFPDMKVEIVGHAVSD